MKTTSYASDIACASVEGAPLAIQWADLGNASGWPDGLGAVATSVTEPWETCWLYGGGFGFDSLLPPGAVVTSVRFGITAKHAVGPCYLTEGVLCNSIVFGALAPVGNVQQLGWQLTGGYAGYAIAGDGETWGVTVDRALVTAGDFGFAFRGRMGDSGMGIYVDAITATVYYEPPANEGGR